MSILSVGIAKGKAEDILDFLSDLGPVPESLRNRISSESNLEILQKWVKQAARAGSIEEFEKEM